MESTTFPEQGDRNNFSTCVLFANSGIYSSHHNFLEQYYPVRFSDPQYWIPKGLLFDLMDQVGNEPPQSQVIDNVSGFTMLNFIMLYRATLIQYPIIKRNYYCKITFHSKLKSMNFLRTMAFKKNFFFYYSIIILLSGIFSTCKKSECIGESFQFKETWNILPQKDSIIIGDTLFLNSSFSNHPFDFNSNATIDFSGSASIGTSFSIRSIKGFNNLTPAIDSFSFFGISGNYNSNAGFPDRIKDVYWLENTGNYQLKFGLIAKKKGDYVFTLSDAIGKINNSGGCSTGGGIYLSNSNVKNNAYLFQPYYSLPQIPVEDSVHIFCIRVK